MENYPGFPNVISGPELSERMVKQAEKFGASIKVAEVNGIEKNGAGFLVKGSEGNYNAKAIIIATGSKSTSLRYLRVKMSFMEEGVSTCATCDGFFYRDKEVVVVGGGDAAVEEGMFLTKFASKVTVVHRRDELRANKEAQKRAFANEKMHWVWDTVVEEVVGADGLVTGVKTRNIKTGEEDLY